MPERPSPEQLRAEVNAAREEHGRVEQQWDAALAKAHRAGHDTTDGVRHLQEANKRGAEVLSALRRYHDAVGKLLESQKGQRNQSK